MGAQLIREVATKTNDVAGDGTTTATVLAQAITREGLKNLSAGANPMVMRKGIDKAVEAAVEAIKANSVPVSGSEDIARVGTVSSGDEAIGALIAEAMEKVGTEGVITIEESKTAETGLEVVEGMQFDKGYISPYFVTDAEGNTVETNVVTITEDATPMVITTQPVNVSGDIGDTAEFTVAVEGGTAPYTYQWQVWDPKHEKWVDLPGFTGPTTLMESLSYSTSFLSVAAET